MLLCNRPGTRICKVPGNPFSKRKKTERNLDKNYDMSKKYLFFCDCLLTWKFHAHYKYNMNTLQTQTYILSLIQLQKKMLNVYIYIYVKQTSQFYHPHSHRHRKRQERKKRDQLCDNLVLISIIIHFSFSRCGSFLFFSLPRFYNKIIFTSMSPSFILLVYFMPRRCVCIHVQKLYLYLCPCHG